MLVIISQQIVHTLTNETFNTNKTQFVKFFAPWCGHCKKLQPIFEELSDSYIGNVEFGEIDCVAFKNTCEDQTIESYPTIKLFHNNQEIEYMGSRTQKDMKKWLDIQIKQQFSFHTFDECKEENQEFDSYFVLYTPNLENLKEFEKYRGEVDFCCIENSDKKLVALREGDEIVWDQQQNMDEFIMENKIGYFPELNYNTYEELAFRKIIALVAMPGEQLITEIHDAKLKYKGYNLAYIDAVKWDKYIETFKKHRTTDIPFLLVLDPKDDDNYYSRLIRKDKNIKEIIDTLVKDIDTGIETLKNKDEL
uniref:Protein disulfide isomerase n=1 Tax=Trepomonas sp. PC1 TaxID=1076344 RepID=A0A146K9Z0_9EUKA|eukprot:JAP92301.1 Protein disulfide isomerase [Trepomonas sp. PC1]